MIRGYAISLIAALPVFFICTPGGCQERQADVKLDTALIRLGEQAQITLTLRSPAQDSVTWPELNDTITSGIEILQASAIDTAYDSVQITTRILTQQLTITSFDSGYHPIPPFLFIAGNDSIVSKALLLSVQSIPVDTTKSIFDIKPPMQVKYSWTDWLKEHWRWFALGAGVIAILLGGIYLWKKRKKIPQVAEMIRPKKPAHTLALEELNKLKEQKLWQRSKVKQYHSRLSEIMREYISGRFGINAPEQTTFEIMEHISHLGLDKELSHALQHLLYLSDMVKFAKMQPLATENEESMLSAFDFVNKTIPQKDTAVKDETAKPKTGTNG